MKETEDIHYRLGVLKFVQIIDKNYDDITEGKINCFDSWVEKNDFLVQENVKKNLCNMYKDLFIKHKVKNRKDKISLVLAHFAFTLKQEEDKKLSINAVFLGALYNPIIIQEIIKGNL